MLKNYFKVAFRTLWRSKGFSSINIAGLAIGMASAMLILLWVQNEISYDRFYEKTDRIYRMYSRDINNGALDAWPRVSSLMGPELKKNYAEVESAVKFRTVYFLMTGGEKHLNLEGAFVDSGFLSMFTFPLIKGNATNALSDPRGIVLTEHLAKNLFGDQDPMGKTVRIDSTDNFKVTGLMKDLPGNTEFSFQYLLPWSYVDYLGWDRNGQSWSGTNAFLYLLLRPGSSEAAFDAKVKDIVKRHISSGEGSSRETFTQPLSRAHLYSRQANGQLVGGVIGTVRSFTIIAVFILLIACINFMNLSTARSEKRAKEVGIRKVVGALKRSLVAQFIGESMLLATISFVLALALVQFSLQAFNQLIGSSLRIDYTDPSFWLLALAFVFITGLLAGSYPAFFLSSFRPVAVLKGAFRQVNALLTPRKVLVVLQFTFAIILIACTIIVQRQIRYARDRDAGYKRDLLAYCFSQGEIIPHYDLIKHDLLSSGAAIAVTKTFSPMTRVWGTSTGLSWPRSTAEDQKINFLYFEADAGFIQTTGTRLLQGRDIDLKTYPTDSAALLLNETAVKLMRLVDPIGKIVKNVGGRDCHIVGVIKDFIIQSPYEAIEPMVIRGLSTGYPVVNFRLNPAGTVAGNLSKAEKVFKTYNPQYPFEYYFVDDQYNGKFRAEQQEGAMGLLFAGLTIVISCLGLFGLATYMAETRIKEIGVRKVLGASVLGITTLLSKDFLTLVLISIVIATPIAWYAMHVWLQGYSYRIGVEWWVFALAGLLSIFISLVTVSYQAIRAALANPVRSLRSE
jgi:putative ABC transport system permease protein